VEAIRRSREAGAATYDLWGLAKSRIAHFKTGFGGREVRFIGAWDLVLSGLGRQVYQTANECGSAGRVSEPAWPRPGAGPVRRVMSDRPRDGAADGDEG